VSANDYKDGLIYVANNGVKGENDSNKFDSEIYDSKLLWAFGNFSRFVRPQMQRIKIETDSKDLMVSAYKSVKELVVVIVNPAQNQRIELPNLTKNQVFDTYTTSKDKNLAHSRIKGTRIELPAEAVVTLVVKLR
jgi:O-glycosyl hydrolase